MVLALIFPNLAGGDCVEDLERRERDEGFAAVLRAIERDLLSRAEPRSLEARWRRARRRAVPSPSAMSAWLERFHDPESGRRNRVHSAPDEGPAKLLAGEPGAVGVRSTTSAGGGGDTRDGCHADRDEQTRCAAQLQRVQSLPAIELLVAWRFVGVLAFALRYASVCKRWSARLTETPGGRNRM